LYGRSNVKTRTDIGWWIWVELKFLGMAFGAIADGRGGREADSREEAADWCAFLEDYRWDQTSYFADPSPGQRLEEVARDLRGFAEETDDFDDLFLDRADRIEDKLKEVRTGLRPGEVN
jgi:hypothetical protein